MEANRGSDFALFEIHFLAAHRTVAIFLEFLIAPPGWGDVFFYNYFTPTELGKNKKLGFW